MPKTFKLVVPTNLSGERLDKVLTSLIPDHSRGFLQNLIKSGAVLVKRKKFKGHSKVYEGEEILVKIPAPKKELMAPEKMDLDILYEDSDLLVLNKPPGIVVHPAAGNLLHTLVHGLLAYSNKLSDINGPLRPGIVHRLDKETSGCLLVAKNNTTHIHLAKQFENREIEKVYWCLAVGRWRFGERKLEGAIGRHPVKRKKMSVRPEGGKEAITLVKPLETFDSFSFLEVRLKTGRTHQIRVHLSNAGHPVMGDKQYGKRKKVKQLAIEVPRQMLHAQLLGLRHPKTEKKMKFTSPLPEDMVKVLDFLRKER